MTETFFIKFGVFLIAYGISLFFGAWGAGCYDTNKAKGSALLCVGFLIGLSGLASLFIGI